MAAVAPRAGAWIEMISALVLVYLITCRPPRGGVD